jgi:hypothetical protein
MFYHRYGAIINVIINLFIVALSIFSLFFCILGVCIGLSMYSEKNFTLYKYVYDVLLAIFGIAPAMLIIVRRQFMLSAMSSFCFFGLLIYEYLSMPAAPL